jgi:drug/metabolite transporter (DMT)-like permease
LNQFFRKIMTLSKFQIPIFTAFALTAFAANSVLNRLALGGNTIDAGSYITLRLVSGAITLWLINAVSKRNIGWILRGSPLSAFYLFLYGVCFSFAYRSLTSGMGAFILFGTVQTTMLTVLLRRGEKPHVSEWVSLTIALSGLIYIVFPGLSAPDPLGAFLMTVAGMAWAFYTLRGKGVKDPLETTATNFIFSVPMIFCIYFLNLPKTHISTEGVVYAVASGAIASGVGYVIWYAALRGLTTTQAALLQLSVPVIAAFGGIIFLSETMTTRLMIGGVLIIGGVTLALVSKPKI